MGELPLLPNISRCDTVQTTRQGECRTDFRFLFVIFTMPRIGTDEHACFFVRQFPFGFHDTLQRKVESRMAKKPATSQAEDSSNSPTGSAATSNAAAKPAETTGKKRPKEKETARETIESVVFAFVLAFLFRTFEAEAFVIPTGSMAPTLFGRHKDIVCEQCGYEFEVGASTEILRDGNIVVSRIQRAACPNCRFSNANAYEAPPFKGDRILVNKFQYELDDPKRFDVVVFKFPEDSKTNYIKRLIGLPGETIKIQGGNVYRKLEGGREEILRKDDPNKQLLIQIPVYDDGFAAEDLQAAGWPNRWAGVSRDQEEAVNEVAGWSESSGSWTLKPEDRSYSLSGANEGNLQWLRYRHFVPTSDTWARMKNGDSLDARPRLIGDYCGYNVVSESLATPETDEVFWVGDLTINGTVRIDDVQQDSELVLELTEGLHWYRCHLDPNTGEARLTRIDSSLDPEDEIEMAVAQTSFQGAGEYDFSFANVDDRVCLWINGSLVDFGPGAEYESSSVHGSLPQETDFTPVGIAAQGLNAVVSNLELERDIYYRGDYRSNETDSLLLGNVAEWQKAYLNHRLEWDTLEYEIPEDHFFVLGDNSPRSSDGRFWETTNTVPRTAFVGKAFYIYWPHGIPVGVEDGLAIKLSYHKRFAGGELVTDKEYPLHYFPFYPDFWRMKRIR